ncbi:MAG: thiamine ABC transporter substrate-binding protein [Anaerolineales bacterium]|jgi:thiamine transport system substrate-binding protein|nr:thiamine ABC transporter substrate-binding protein [Anaerolineales bacterium]
MQKLLLILIVLTLAACAPQPSNPAPGPLSPSDVSPSTLTIMTHDSFSASEEVIRAFEEANNVRLFFLKSGDTGSALNKAILSKSAPLADLFYGVDNTFLSRALDADIFEPYNAPLLAQIPAEFQLDSQNRALPVNFGDVCINYDKAWFAEKNLPVPQTLADLTKPEYKGLLVVQNPATSSPGLAFLLATIERYGPQGYLDYWRALKANDVTVVDGWETAYYTNFSASSGQGPQPLVVSYSSSPAAEVLYAAEPLADAPTASILDGCYRQIEFVGILKGTPHRAMAEKFINFMLNISFQADMPLNMFVYPVNPAAQLPAEFVQYAQTATNPARLDPAANRETWIQAWTETVLR